MVILFNFAETEKPARKKVSTKIELAPDKQKTGTETPIKQALVSSINNTNISNNTNLGEQPQNFKMHLALSNFEKSKVKKELHAIPSAVEGQSVSSRAFDIKRRTATSSQVFLNPDFENVKAYFLEQNFPELEAQKFFNYFSSNGWLVGGKTPMMDWKASAQNWMLNTNKFNSTENKNNRAKHLKTITDKDYSEPL